MTTMCPLEEPSSEAIPLLPPPGPPSSPPRDADKPLQNQQIVLMCDGLRDDVLALLRNIVKDSRFMARVQQPKILIYGRGYQSSKQRNVWLQHATRACNKVFDCGDRDDTVKMLDFNETSAMPLLEYCNIFHMAGGNAWKLVEDWHRHPDHLQVLQKRVRSGEIFFIGSSAGAIAAGRAMRYCVDDRAGLDDVNSKGLRIIDLNVGVFHSNQHNFKQVDNNAVFLGPGTAIFFNGEKCKPAIGPKVHPFAMESLLSSPCIADMLLHQPPTRIPTFPSFLASCQNPVTTTMPLDTVLEKGGEFLWDNNPAQVFHVQPQNTVYSSRSPFVVLWLPESGGHTKLAVSQRQTAPTATVIHNSATLVSPHSTLKYKATVPDWIVNLTSALTQHVGGHLVLVGFSRGAKWCHEIIGKLLTMNVPMPHRCLLVAPYCHDSMAVEARHAHALAIKQGLTKVRSICTTRDTDCPWSTYGGFIMAMGEVRNVTEAFPSHDKTRSGFLTPNNSAVAQDVQWLLGCHQAHDV